MAAVSKKKAASSNGNFKKVHVNTIVRCAIILHVLPYRQRTITPRRQRTQKIKAKR